MIIKIYKYSQDVAEKYRFFIYDDNNGYLVKFDYDSDYEECVELFNQRVDEREN